MNCSNGQLWKPTKISKIKELGEGLGNGGALLCSLALCLVVWLGSECIGDSVLGVDAIFEVDASAIIASVRHLHCKKEEASSQSCTTTEELLSCPPVSRLLAPPSFPLPDVDWETSHWETIPQRSLSV